MSIVSQVTNSSICKQYSSIFEKLVDISKADKIKNKGKQGISSSTYKKDFDKDYSSLKNFISSNGNTSQNFESSYEKYLGNSSKFLQSYVKDNDLATLSLEKFSKAYDKAFVKNQSANKGLSSIKKIINEYNEIIKGKDGNSKLHLSIDEFIESVGESRPKLARFLGDLNGTSTSFTDFAKSVAGATLKTLAFKAAAIAADAALTMGISALVQLGLEGISYLLNYYDELDQKVKDVTATYKEQKTSLTDTSKELETLKSNYAKFSPHIDSANQNIDLPVEEYQEYLDTCNKLGEMFPTLVQGYDSQGNAILKCKGNVEELTDEINKADINFILKRYKDTTRAKTDIKTKAIINLEANYSFIH